MKNTIRIKTPMVCRVNGAQDFIDRLNIPNDLTGYKIILHGYNTRLPHISFSEDLIKELVLLKNLDQLEIYVAGREFTKQLLDAAQVFDVSDRVYEHKSQRF